jgi:hypothetical protein
MQSHPPSQNPRHDHVHHDGHSHAHSHPTDPARSLLAQDGARDLKSPVLIGVAQRLLWSVSLLVILWLAVVWALRTNG